MTPEQKTAAMQRARWNARENAAPTEVPSTTRCSRSRAARAAWASRRSPSTSPPRSRARASPSGVLDADIWGFSVPRMLGVDGRLGGTDGKITPNASRSRVDATAAPGELKVVSMGFLVDDEGTALMWRGLILTKALEQFLTDVRWGDMDYLLIDMPPGTGDIQMGLARMLPQAEMLVVTTPARAAQKVAVRVADMARRSYMKVVGVVENMSELVLADGSRHAVFGSGGGDALPPRSARRSWRGSRSSRRCRDGGDTGQPSSLSSPGQPGRRAFHALADRVVDDLLPPIEMSGCTARLLRLIAQAEKAADA